MKRILITRTDRMGDVILSSPAFKAVREAWPDSYIAVMVRPYTRECVEGNPYIDEVILYDKRGRHKSAFGSLVFARELKEKRFDLALILHPTNRAHIVTFLAGIPERIGYRRKMAFLLTKAIPHTKERGEKHEIDYTFDVIRAAGITPAGAELYMPISREAEESIEKRLSERGLAPGDRLITIHPSSSCVSKKWMAERFAEAADRLADKYKARIVLVGNEGSIADTASTAERMERAAIDLSGKISISELASLLKRCILFVSNDSGPVHAASAVGTPVISIFGRNAAGLGPRRWGPTGKNDVALRGRTDCDPCLAHNCEKDFQCLRSINTDEVLKAADKILRSKQ